MSTTSQEHLIRVDDEAIDVDVVRRLHERIGRLTGRHRDTLESFWLPDGTDGARFALTIPDDQKPHVATTATCVLSLFDSPVSALPSYLERMRDDVARWLLQESWTSEGLPRLNVYTTPLVVTALLTLAPNTANTEEVRAGIEVLLAALESVPADRDPGSDDGVDRSRDEGGIVWPTPQGTVPYRASGYLTYWALRALEKYEQAAEQDLLVVLQPRLAAQMRRAFTWAEREFRAQLAFRDMNDFDQFEPFNLIYALAIVDRENEKGEIPPNVRTLSAGLRALFGAQLPNGLWARGLPKFHYKDRGNVYPFAFEVLSALMKIGGRRSRMGSFEIAAELFHPFLSHLERTLEWAESHEVQNAGIFGWRSNWIPGLRPHSWSTAVVLLFAQNLEALLNQMMSAQAQREFQARMFYPSLPTTPPPSESNWTTVETRSVKIKGRDDSATTTELIFRHFLAPRLGIGDGRNAAWSAVFFGPTGTRKTTLASEIARALEWPFITIQTSDFLEEGADKMGFQARQIFRRLEEISEAVVLIDEVEEFVLDRSKAKDTSSRLITTAMLTLLQGLRDRRRVIFLLATNHVESFDPAILRPGRFDMILFVAPAGADQKLPQLVARLNQFGLATTPQLLRQLTSHSGEIDRFNQSEWEAFLAGLGQGSPQTTAEAKARIRQWSETLTITAANWKAWRGREHIVQIV